MIALCGEFPVYSVGILGNRREYRKRIYNMSDEQTYQNPYTGERITVKALTVASQGRTKTVRILKNATELLKWTDYYRTYSDRYLNSTFRGDESSLDRRHRIAEMAAMFLRAGIEIETDPNADMKQKKQAVLYMPHIFKTPDNEVDSKTIYTRITGCYKTPDNCFAVYNTRDRVMQWTGLGELKSKLVLHECTGTQVSEAIMFGKDYQTGMNTTLHSDVIVDHSHFHKLFHRIYFVPLNETGLEMLELISRKDFSSSILDLLFSPSDRSYDSGSFNYHAKVGDVFVYSFLDSDLNGLIEFKNGMRANEKNEVLCYDFQTDFIRNFFTGTGIRITEVPFDEIRENLK